MDRLPEELLVNVVSLTSPIDACRAAAVSRAFRAAAGSDGVWSGFLPRNLPQFAKGELPRKPMSKKELFRRLSDQPALLPHKIIGKQLDRATGTERLTISSRALQTPPGNSGWLRVRVDSVSSYSKRDNGWRPACVDSVSNYSKRDRRFFFSEAVFWFSRLEIRAKIQRKILSQNTTYAVYMVFKLNLPYYRHDFRIQEASIGVAGREPTRQVCLQGYVKDGDGVGDPPQKHILLGYRLDSHVISPLEDNVHFPRERADGWMEVRLGEFQNSGGDGGDDVFIRLTEEPQSTMVYVWVIELRSKTLPPT
ncbi:hypothetical protein ACQ4PT_004155 [Festuca glaucescens]